MVPTVLVVTKAAKPGSVDMSAEKTVPGVQFNVTHSGIISTDVTGLNPLGEMASQARAAGDFKAKRQSKNPVHRRIFEPPPRVLAFIMWLSPSPWRFEFNRLPRAPQRSAKHLKYAVFR